MGGVCTGGTMKHHPDFNDKNDSGFSGKLKSIKSFGKQKKRKDDGDDDDLDSSYSYSTDLEVFEKKRTPHIFDSGELHFSISRELKPSTRARTVVATKVLFQIILFIGQQKRKYRINNFTGKLN